MLSGADLLKEIKDQRLVIQPPVRVTNRSVSVDFRLHDVFWQSILPAGTEDLDIVAGLNADPYKWMKPQTLTEVVLKPQGFMLGETAEAISLPLDICGWIEGKSGRARLGIEVHLTAPKIDPGWGSGRPKRVTLEIVNNNEIPIRLRAGAPIAQMVFHRLETPVAQPYGGHHGRRGSQA